MHEEPNIKPPNRKTAFSREIGVQEARKLKARRKAVQSIWSGFGMFGLIGWSVAVPTLVGALLGLWLDKHYPGNRFWTLTLLIIGLCIGCLNAWHWVAKEGKKMRDEQENKDE